MPITPKPDKNKKQESVVSEDVIKAIVNRGGGVPETDTQQTTTEIIENESGLKRLQLRLKVDWLIEIDSVRSKRSKLAVPSRHNWIMEAISEKLDREKKNGIRESEVL